MVTTDALTIIDAWLERTPHREQFSADEIEDLLLDLRSCVLAEPVLA